MGWYDYDYYERRSRRPASGIKAQTQRGQFGKTWWASRWIAALERLVDSARLSRGRSYARSGQVTKLEVSKKGVLDYLLLSLQEGAASRTAGSGVAHDGPAVQLGRRHHFAPGSLQSQAGHPRSHEYAYARPWLQHGDARGATDG